MNALDLLPHGPDFRFIDRLLHLEPGQSATAEYKLRGDEPFLRGHFPGQPLMPGVLLVEAGAQLAGVIAQSDPTREPLKNLKLTAIRNVKILGSALPNETIRIEAQITGRMAGLIQSAFTIHVADKKIAQGEVTLAGDDAISS